MLLTGKAKQHFETWMKNNQGYIYPDTPLIKVRDDVFLNIEFTPESMQYGMYVEWFDSVGIYVKIQPNKSIVNNYTVEYISDIFTDKKVFDTREVGVYKTRNEAAKAAILKANEIYNG